MSGQHTPGPWYVASDAAEDCPAHANSGLARIETSRLGDWPIARLCEWNNVPLLIAAPELLAALKLLADYDHCPDGVSEEEYKSALAHACAAIDKAEGRT